MNAELAVTETVRELAPQTTPMMLLQAAVAANVDAAQLEKLMDLQERYEANQARKAFAAALAKFQAECPRISKSKTAERGNAGKYDYAPLEVIQDTIRPYLAANGLSVRFTTKTEGNTITAVCYVTHEAGHVVENQFTAPVDGKMSANDTQKMGSARSYAKRYSLTDALNLETGDVDDDGESAGTEFISNEQMMALQKDLEELGINKVKFCKFMDIPSIKEMPLAKLPIAENFIKVKRDNAKPNTATEE